MKKLLSMLLVLVLLCTCLAACAKTPAPSTEPSTQPQPSQDTQPSSDPTEATEDRTDYTLKLADDSILWQLPVYQGDRTKFNWLVQDMGNKAQMLSMKQVETRDGYDRYQKDLASAGFQLYTSNEILDNHFATWIKDNVYVTTMYMPGYENVRVVAEYADTTVLPGLEKDNVYTDAGVENVVAMVGTDFDGETNNGMCFIYRLCDGSFIVVDGGFDQASNGQAIYDTMVKLAPDPENITIAAWFITHAHGDHVGGLYSFASRFGSKVTLEKIIYNVPTFDVFHKCNTSVQHLVNIPSATGKFGGSPVLQRAHPGQKLYIRDAQIEILHTWEMYSLPNENLSYFNDSSLVFTLHIGDTKIMQFGDCGPKANDVLEKIYDASVFKSDIVQTAHHGYIGVSPEMNEMVDADVVLWPTTDYKFPLFNNEDHNKVLLKADHIYIADQRVTVIPLPFDADKVETWVIEGYTPRK